MRRLTPCLPVLGPAMAAAMVLAACGSSSPSASSASGPSGQTPAQMARDGVRFSDCMRSHAVTGFPDPTDPRAFKEAFNPNGPEARSPAFQSAYTACGHLLPKGTGPSGQSSSRAQFEAMLAFARCVRSRGFPSFPDPTSGGELTHEMVAAAGIDLHQPAVLRVGDVCSSVTHGFITQATVARFVAGQ